jgi:hypothetical protein
VSIHGKKNCLPILGAPYCSYTIYQRSLLEIERPAWYSSAAKALFKSEEEAIPVKDCKGN